MNKRIEEIWEETTKTCIPREGDYSCVSKENIQKFAELIAKECCDIFVELRPRPADLAVKDVKLHFGIKE